VPPTVYLVAWSTAGSPAISGYSAGHGSIDPPREAEFLTVERVARAVTVVELSAIIRIFLLRLGLSSDALDIITLTRWPFLDAPKRRLRRSVTSLGSMSTGGTLSGRTF
jgi:hypothetical protein